MLLKCSGGTTEHELARRALGAYLHKVTEKSDTIACVQHYKVESYSRKITCCFP